MNPRAGLLGCYNDWINLDNKNLRLHWISAEGSIFTAATNEETIMALEKKNNKIMQEGQLQLQQQQHSIKRAKTTSHHNPSSDHLAAAPAPAAGYRIKVLESSENLLLQDVLDECSEDGISYSEVARSYRVCSSTSIGAAAGSNHQHQPPPRAVSSNIDIGTNISIGVSTDKSCKNGREEIPSVWLWCPTEAVPAAADLCQIFDSCSSSTDAGTTTSSSSSVPSRKRSRPDEESDSDRDSLDGTGPQQQVGVGSAVVGRFRDYQACQWTEKFRELCEFKRVNGHCLVPWNHSSPSLARWVKRQRYQRKQLLGGKFSTMTPQRISILEGIGFTWDCQINTWEERVADLKAYKEAHGHCNVPTHYAENPALAMFVKCQRRQYKLYMQGEHSSMTPERISELESHGFSWGLRSYKRANSRSGSENLSS